MGGHGSTHHIAIAFDDSDNGPDLPPAQRACPPSRPPPSHTRRAHPAAPMPPTARRHGRARAIAETVRASPGLLHCPVRAAWSESLAAARLARLAAVTVLVTALQPGVVPSHPDGSAGRGGRGRSTGGVEFRWGCRERRIPVHRPPCPHSSSTASAAASMHKKHAGSSASAVASERRDGGGEEARHAGAGPRFGCSSIAECRVAGTGAVSSL
jgi:hypothetical protein